MSIWISKGFRLAAVVLLERVVLVVVVAELLLVFMFVIMVCIAISKIVLSKQELEGLAV